MRSLTIHALGKEAYGCIPHPLTRCPWKQEQKLVGFQALTELELVNFCLCADSEAEDDWLNIFPWSQLTHVSLTCGSFLVHSAVGERLKHVQSLSISLDPSYEYGPGCGSDFDKSLVNHYLMTCDRLARLKMVNCSLTVDEKLFIHLGGTLKELELHQYEEYGGARPVLNSTQVEQIGKHCPSLRKLAIDIHDLYGWVSCDQRIYSQVLSSKLCINS